MEYIDEISNRLSVMLEIPVNKVSDALFAAFDGFAITKPSLDLIKQNQTIEEKAFNMFFVAKMTEGLSENSLKDYKGILNSIFSEINKSFLNITTDDVRIYLTKRSLVDKIAKSTMNNERRVLNSFYTWLTAEEYILKNPMLRIKNIKEGFRIKEAFTEEELEIMRKHSNT